jgi:hypothetical protein
MLSEFSFQCDTKMPASITDDFVQGTEDHSDQVHTIDLAPMNKESVDSTMSIALFGKDNHDNWIQMSVQNPAADADLQIDSLHWTMTPILGKVSEATWHWIDPAHMPAAANTIPAIVGFTVQGFCVLTEQTALIPIAKLYDVGNSRPLPFATGFTISYAQYQSYGVAAEAYASLAAASASAQVLDIASAITSGGQGFFAEQRTTSGLPTPGNSPVANRAMLYRRSSPPQIAPITTGLTMAPPALPAPPVINRPPVILPVALGEPRLRAVLRGLPQVASDVPTTLRTTVKSVAAAAGIARMAAPLADVPGSGLIRIKSAAAPAPTRIAKTSSTLRSAELGWVSGKGHQQEIAQAQANLVGNGLTVPAGTTHIWDVPANLTNTLVITGGSAFRVTFLTRGGSVIADTEYPPAVSTTIQIPPRCGMFSVECLGNLPAGVSARAPGFAAITFTAAPAGRKTVAGWQAGNLLPQVGPTTILGRGSCIVLPQTHIPLRDRQAISQTMVRVADAVAGQIGTETWLPVSIGAVMILLDLQDATSSDDGDLAISAQGATLAANPIRILGGRRRALLYDIAEVDAKAARIIIGVASAKGWRLSGVVGLPGKSQEWATDLQGKVPEQVVPDGPLTPDGSISVQLSGGGDATAATLAVTTEIKTGAAV